MRQFDYKERAKTRNPEHPGDAAGLALPRRIAGTLFQGWGPKLMLAALAGSALCAPAMAQVSFIGVSSTGLSYGAPDRATAIRIAVDYADSANRAKCAGGTIQNEAPLSVYAGPDGWYSWSARVVLTATCVLGN
jgi:hypothetical protein